MTDQIAAAAHTPGPAARDDILAVANARNQALRAINADLLAALRDLADTSRAYIGAMDAEDIATLERARAAIAAAESR